MFQIVGIESYGTQRVCSPSGEIVSAYKIGYSTVGRAVLLSLYGSQALDVTSKHASYHYVRIAEETCVYHGFLLFVLTDEEVAKVEQHTRHHPTSRSGCWRWLKDQWHKFPSSIYPEYKPAVGHEGPNFDPTRFRLVSPSTGTKMQVTEAIHVERSQRAGQKTWWWITGATYPHREILKPWGCRWSKGKSAWYYIGDVLPNAVQALVTVWGKTNLSAQEVDTPCTDVKAESRLGIELETPFRGSDFNTTQAIPPHAFALGQTVYTAHLLRITASLKLPADTQGQIVRRYQYRQQPFNPLDAYLGEYAYEVQFEGYERAFPVFEENLRDKPVGGTIQRDECFVVLLGVSAQMVIERSIQRRQNIPHEYEVLDELPAIPLPHCVNELSIQALLPEEKSEAIRVIMPKITEDDPLFSAIQSAKQHRSLTALPKASPHQLTPIGQKYVGELTGSITGNVYCYGYCTHQGILLYLNMGGPRMAVEAIRARLAKGEIVNLVPWDAAAIELSAGETDGKVNTGMFTAYLNSISEAKFTSAILIHEWLTQPNYGGKSVTGIFRTSEEQAIAKLLHHVRQLVNIPVFDGWASYLYHAGQSAGLLRKPHSDGDIDLLVLDLDLDSWSRLITGGLANGVIQLPVNTGENT